VCSLTVNDRGQAEDCNLSPNTMQSNRSSLLCVNIGQYRAKNRGNCGIAVLSRRYWYRRKMVPWCRASTVVPRDTSNCHTTGVRHWAVTWTTSASMVMSHQPEGNGKVVECFACYHKVAGSNLTRDCSVPTPTQHVIHQWSVNEYQQQLGSKWAHHAIH